MITQSTTLTPTLTSAAVTSRITNRSTYLGSLSWLQIAIFPVLSVFLKQLTTLFIATNHAYCHHRPFTISAVALRICSPGHHVCPSVEALYGRSHHFYVFFAPIYSMGARIGIRNRSLEWSRFTRTNALMMFGRGSRAVLLSTRDSFQYPFSDNESLNSSLYSRPLPTHHAP